MNTNPNSPTVQDHPASFSPYIKQGWKLVPIPKGTKGPRTQGWNQQQNCIGDEAHLVPGSGYGLAHAYSGTMAVDIDHWERAQQEMMKHGIDLNALYAAPDAVIIDSGKPGHGKLLYRMPDGISLPSKKLIDTDESGLKYNYIDFRSATSAGSTVQDVLPPSIHPETLQPYRWAGHGHWSRLPTIPDNLLRFWQDLVSNDQQRIIPDGTPISASWDDVRHAIDHISPDITRDEWVQVGMALHWVGVNTNDEQTAFVIWDEWSARSETKYKGQKDLLNSWRSFNPNNGVTLGTLFHIAQQHGWKRQIPSAEEIFSNVTVDRTPKDLFMGLKTPPPDPNLDLFPETLRTRALEMADSMGADPLVPLFAGLASIAGAVDARIRLELVPGFQVPPVLWLVTVGKPADKKSPASLPMTEILRDLEKEDIPHYKDRLLQWEGQEAKHSAAHKAFLEYHASAEGQMENDAVPAVPDLAPRPVSLKITVSDITSQKLVYHTAERPRGVLCWMDEMKAWTKALTDSKSIDNRSTWTQSFESKPYEMERVGSGSTYCENLAVSIYGNIQPKVFRDAAHKLSDDGLVQRFIPAILRSEYSRRIGDPVPDCFSSKPIWDQVVRTAYALPKQTYRLSADAHRIFREFQEWHNKLQFEEDLLQADDTYQGAIGKLTGLCGRLCLVLHVIEAPFLNEVTGDLMQRTVDIVKGYVVPSLRHLYDEISTQQQLDTWMFAYILHQAGLKDTITLRELKHAARRKLTDVSPTMADKQVMDSMVMVEQANWAVMTEADPRRNAYTWTINPQLLVMYKEQRDMVIQIKQARMDDIWEQGGRRSERRFIPGYEPETMDDLWNKKTLADDHAG